jgi:NTP pyrophosphatase (non-canonical NTP hydrolase)
MDFDSYLDEARKTAIYPREKALEYLALGLASEAGEVAGKAKKWFRDDELVSSDWIADELGDVLWYLAMLADEFGYSLTEIAEKNLEKLRDRQARGQLQGSGDGR